MSQFDDMFLQEKLTTIEEVGDGDKIMGKLGEEKTQTWKDITAINAEGAIKAQQLLRLERDLTKLSKRFDSKRFLFWDAVEQSDERFESAVQRGKMLAVKKDADGSLVVVEFDAPKSKLNGIFIMPPPDEMGGLNE